MVPEHWTLVAIQTRNVPNRLYAEVLDVLFVLGKSFRDLTGYDLCVLGWAGDCCFCFRNPRLTPNQSNRVVVELNRTLQEIDKNWGVWYEGETEFHCGYGECTESTEADTNG